MQRSGSAFPPPPPGISIGGNRFLMIHRAENPLLQVRVNQVGGRVRASRGQGLSKVDRVRYVVQGFFSRNL